MLARTRATSLTWEHYLRRKKLARGGKQRHLRHQVSTSRSEGPHSLLPTCVSSDTYLQSKTWAYRAFSDIAGQLLPDSRSLGVTEKFRGALLAHDTGTNAQQPSGESSPDQAKADAARWTLVSRLSSRLPGAHAAQGAQQSSASGQSTPSNLERAVLLLEAETESVNGDNKAPAVASALRSPTQPAGDWEPAPSAPGVIYTADLDDRLEGSSAPKASLKQKPANVERPQSVPALQDEADSTDLEARQSALRRVNLGEDSKAGQVARDDLDEGPSTPPASSAAARADTKASSSPNSTAGGHLLGMCVSAASRAVGTPR